jgi:uncharacterized protein
MADLEANKALVRKAVAALARLNTEQFLSYLTDDVRFETPGQHECFAGVRGKADLRKELPAMRTVLPNGIVLTITSMTAEDDAELVGKGKTAGGVDYNNRYHYAVVVRDGKISRFCDYFDSDLAVRVLVSEMTQAPREVIGRH